MTIASRLLRAVCLATALAPFSAATEDDAGSPPNNVLVIMVDQLSAKWLEAASNGIVATPGLDRLRAAVREENPLAEACPADLLRK